MNQIQHNQSDASALISALETHADPKPVELGDDIPDAIVLPQGRTILSLKKLRDEYAKAPDRREGTAHLTTLESFITHTNRFQDPSSAIFADSDPNAPKLVSVFDYHEPGPDGAPRFCRHRGIYAFPFSDEWQRWTRVAGQYMSQPVFAEFIESNILNVVDPEQAGDSAKRFAQALRVDLATPSRIMELSRGLALKVSTKVKNAIAIGSGEAQIQYETEHTGTDGSTLSVPGAFLLGLRVFRGGVAYQVPARLRYRHKDGAITWAYELWRTDMVFEDAFNEVIKTAADGTKLPIYQGTPEV